MASPSPSGMPNGRVDRWRSSPQVPLNPDGNHPDFPTLPDGSGRDVLFDWKLKDTWKQMEDLLKTGKVKSIGVSNFSQKKLEEEILPYATVVPAVDQVGALIVVFD